MENAEQFAAVERRMAQLHRESETLRKAGTWTALASIAATLGAGFVFVPLAAALGVVGSAAAAAMLYKKINDERELASLKARPESEALPSQAN